MEETINAWIRSTGIDPIFLGWIGAICILAAYESWRSK